eukprot:11133354-Alexandrium_andersonii.AAC.1
MGHQTRPDTTTTGHAPIGLFLRALLRAGREQPGHNEQPGHGKHRTQRIVRHRERGTLRARRALARIALH